MLALKILLALVAAALFGSCGLVVGHDIYVAARLRALLQRYGLRSQQKRAGL